MAFPTEWVFLGCRLVNVPATKKKLPMKTFVTETPRHPIRESERVVNVVANAPMARAVFGPEESQLRVSFDITALVTLKIQEQVAYRASELRLGGDRDGDQRAICGEVCLSDFKGVLLVGLLIHVMRMSTIPQIPCLLDTVGPGGPFFNGPVRQMVLMGAIPEIVGLVHTGDMVGHRWVMAVGYDQKSNSSDRWLMAQRNFRYWSSNPLNDNTPSNK